ncbi:MAG: S8 family serine peptidase [Gammaproteobacteria bacterium]|nr:S8 family serine peptidase [Gammaproteobacteria bacterium]
MNKILLQLTAISILSCMSCQLLAQSDVALATRKAELQSLSEKLKKRDENARAQAAEFARQTGLPLRRELPNGGVLELQRINQDSRPVFYITNNVDAADTISTDEVWPGGSAGLNLDGSGMTIGEWDGGAVFPDHPDFTGRLTQVDGATAISGHSTHVAGTLAGAGDWLYPDSRGMSFAAQLQAWDWNSDSAEMALAASGGLLVSNHSYGIAAGWLYIGDVAPDTWWWIGGPDPDDVEDPYFGYYDTETQLWDQIAFDAPYYLIVKAAGNDRSDIGPAPGEEYTVIDQDGNFLFTSTLARQPDCAPAGYDCLPTASVAKNVLTVGAVDDLIGGYSVFSGPAAVQMLDFSGWGPTDDGRIKPDVVGNGMFLFSAWPDSPYYALAAGTSMSAPNVSGSLLLLQQHYQNENGAGNFMRAATLKALAIHTADEAGDSDGPDYEYGWGLVNTRAASTVISEDGGAHRIIEGSLANGSTDTVEITVSNPSAVVSATLVWNDPPGTPVTLVLDAPDPMLVNDLDLRIQHETQTHLPWVLNPASPAAAATRGDNFRDNVEQVVIEAGGAGSYFVEVGHKGVLLDSANQEYSLILSIEPPPPTGSGFLIDEDFSAGLPPDWTVETNPLGVPWAVRPPQPGGSRLDNNTGGTGNFAMVDNNYSHVTVTSLQPPTFDLSNTTNAVLRFKSYFVFDTLESINVDVSTDGGSAWTNAWSFQGFNPVPTTQVLDLSAAAAGQPSFSLRFRYDSENEIQGDLWQVDDVEFEVFGGSTPPGDPPAPAGNPNPADGTAGMALDAQLAWSAGSLADSHDVYFGTSDPPSVIDFRGNQTGTSFDPGALEWATTYFWRIDEINDDGLTRGDTWSFTTAAEPAPVETINLAGFDGGMTPAPRGRWNAVVTISARNHGGDPESGVTAEGIWSDGTSGTASCSTQADGSCTVTKQNLKSRVSSVTFTLNSLVKTGMVYEPADNAVNSSTVVSQSDSDQTPVAVDDAFQGDIDTAVSGNVISNDDPGDGPAGIAGNTVPANGTLDLAGDGGFTYTPDGGFTGTDSFTYSISDQDGDVSNTATVSITISGIAPPPSGDPSISLHPFKVKGKQRVEVTWLNFGGDTVEITRDGNPVAESPTVNDGSYEDQIGVKGGGQTYDYTVCETGASTCVSASTGF